ncbi:MAG: sialidase domain-containing protein [Mediterraneibacter sp.]
MKKKKLLAFLLAAAMVCQSGLTVFAQEPGSIDVSGAEVQADDTAAELECKTYLEEERTYNGEADSRYAVPEEDLEFINDLGSATITVSFKTESSGLMALAAVNSTVHTNSYITLYVNNGNTLGVEIRDASTNMTKGYTANVGTLNDNEWHTATFVIDEGVGYKLYFDQEMVKEVSEPETYFTKNLSWEPSSVTFGGANRLSGNSYLYTGSIKNAKLYNGVASEEQIIRDHGGVVLEDPVITYGRNVFDGTNDGIVVKDEDAAAIAGLTQGTFSFAYKLDDLSNKLNGLFSLSEKGAENGYGAFYVNPSNGRIGFEVRDGSGHQYVTVPDGAANNTNWHTITVSFSGTQAAFYFDGEAVGTVDAAGVLTGSSWTADSVSIGGIQRTKTDKWPFSGTINSVSIYDYVLNADEVRQLNRDTKPEDIPEYEEGVIKTEEYGIFDMGDYGSFNYRIPSIVTTADGVVIAGADQRHDHWSDWGNIDTVVRMSTDQGQTWSDLTTVIDLKSQPYDSGTQSAFLIDPVMIATESGRVWMMVDMFPESTGFGSISQAGNGFAEAEDGNMYLELTDADGAKYTLRGTEVYDADGNKTDYTVDEGSAENAYHNKGDLYDNGEYVGNIYLSGQNTGNDSAPLQVLKTCYLWLTYSDDNGETWSNPVNISGMVKEDWMKFCGTGPGFGIEIQNGEHAGRLVFPIYYTNNGGFQSSACIYSDDGGVTWQRGMSPNDARGEGMGDSQNPNFSQQLTESQIIELNSGNLLQFMRNTGGSGLVAVSRSTDGGATWSAPVNTQATEVYCQLSVLHYGTTEDGKDRVILSNPGGSGRNNGTLRIGVVTETDDSFSIEWTESKMFSPGNYAYSCLTDMGDDMIGLLYEKSNTIKFTSFNLDFITSEVNLVSPTITSVTYTVEKETDHLFTLPGDKYVFTVNTDQNVIAEGAPTFRFMLDGEARYADYVSGGNNDKSVVFEYVVQEGDEGQIAYRGPKIISDENGSVRNEAGLSVSAIDTQVDFGYIGVDPSYDGYDLPLDNASATAGSSQSGQGPEKALDGDTSTLWHSQWSAGHNRADHWFVIDYGKEYMMDGLRYLPRQTGGTNGIITEYKIEVSTDGVAYTEAATGEWDSSTSWKTADFEPVKARYMKLTVLDALSVESANDYASATEIRVTGTEAPTEPADKTELQVAYDLAAAMDLSIYTDESRQVMEEAIAAAAEVLANENALQAEIDEALNNLNAAKDQLELKAVDKSELEKMIALADEYAGKIGSYTPDSAEAFQAAYDAAKTVFENAEASQEEVDNIVEVLQKAIDGLELAKEISTAVLEYALALAETADTEGVLDSVAEIFNNAKASAQNILERVQAGDASVTQDMVDESWQNLIKAMQYLSFKQGDKTDLQKVIDLANSLDLSQYLDEGQQAFNDALTAAEAVLADGNAMQDEVDQAWKALLKAMSELRLKPSKDALEDLIASAEGLNTEGADEETVAVFRSALARAMSVLEDDQATEAEVASAEKELQSAIDLMLASTDGSTDGSGQSGTGNANSSGSQNSGSNASKTSTSGSKAVKTGDSMFPIAGSAAAMAMAAAVIVLQRKKRS